MWRFKTEEEFKTQGMWKGNQAKGWTINMNKYLGQPIPEHFHDNCACGKGFHYHHYYFASQDYVRDTSIESYFFKDHIGRQVETLIDNPNGGILAKGSIGTIISEFTVNFPNWGNYSVSQSGLNPALGKYRLVPLSSSSSKFKVGDEVQITNSSKFFHQGTEMKGTVQSLNGDIDYKYSVLWENGNSFNYNDEDLEYYTEPVLTTKPFEKGSEVMIRDSSHFKHQGYDGNTKMKGVILRETSKYSEWREVKWSNGHSYSYKNEDLEHYNPPKEIHTSLFKVGTSVLIKDSSPYKHQGYSGTTKMVGVVITENSSSWKVKWENGYEDIYREEDLELFFKPVQIADKIESKRDSLIREAKAKYPIGTKFYPAHVSIQGSYCTVVDHNSFDYDSINDNLTLHTPTGHEYESGGYPDQYGNCSLNRVLYSKGKWAVHHTPIYTSSTTDASHTSSTTDEYKPGNFVVGNYITSLMSVPGLRTKYEVFVALRFSSMGDYIYYSEKYCGLKESFRKATPEEIKEYLSTMSVLTPKESFIPLEPKTFIEPVHSVKAELRTKRTKFKL